MGMRPPRVHLTIDRLVLGGVAPAQREAVLEVLAAELGGLLASKGARQALGGSRSLAQARAQPFRIEARDGGVGLGREIARGLHGALKS
jgi:hypothetical protein